MSRRQRQKRGMRMNDIINVVLVIGAIILVVWIVNSFWGKRR